MEPDALQQAWQAHSSRTRVTVDADSLLRAVRQNQQDLQAEISWGEFAVIGIALLLLPIWIYIGVANASPWTWYLMAPALIWTIGFSLVVRKRRKQTLHEPTKPLLSGVQESLALVEHQIWLNRHSVWWYVLPMAIPLLAFFAHVSWLKSRDWVDALCDVNALIFVFFAAFSYFMHWSNQRVVRTKYEPRRQELLALLASLRDETSEVSGEYQVLMSAARVSRSSWRLLVAVLCMAATLPIVIAAIIFGSRHDHPEHPERSPFAAVRWQQSRPEVKVGNEWFKLVSLNELPASEIVAFSKRTYGRKWQQRFEEDLVELLSRMGHPPKETVTLVVQSLASEETRTLERVPMTTANRRAIRDAAYPREGTQHPPGMQQKLDLDEPVTQHIPHALLLS